MQTTKVSGINKKLPSLNDIEKIKSLWNNKEFSRAINCLKYKVKTIAIEHTQNTNNYNYTELENYIDALIDLHIFSKLDKKELSKYEKSYISFSKQNNKSLTTKEIKGLIKNWISSLNEVTIL